MHRQLLAIPAADCLTPKILATLASLAKANSNGQQLSGKTAARPMLTSVAADERKFRGLPTLAWGVHTDRAVWHEPKQFSSELNNISLVGPRAIYGTEVCTEVCAGVIYPNKVVSEPGYDKQWQKTLYSWSSTVTAVSEERYRGRGYDRGNKAEQKQVKIMEDKRDKLVASKEKEASTATGDSDDALVCCVENTVEDRIIDSDDKTLDIAAVRDVVLKTSFGTSWTLKDVRYIPGLKDGIISLASLVRKGYPRLPRLAEEGDQRLGDMSRIGMSMLASKGNILDVQKVDIDLSFIMLEKTRNCRGWSKFIQKAMALHLLHQSKDPATMILLSKTAAGVAFGVAERLSRTFRAESTGIRAEAPKMLWADSVSTTYLIYGIPYVPIGLRIPEEEWRGKDTSLAHLKAVAQMKCDTAFGIRRVTRLSDAEILHLRTQFMEPENDSIVAEHGLSSEITQSPGGSSDMSEGSENSESFKDSGRSDEEYSEDGASETPQVRRSTRECRAPVRYSPSANYLLLTENGEPKSYSEALSSKEFVQWKKAIIEEMVSLEKNQTCSLVRLPAGKKASQSLLRDYHISLV
ncbi:retrovirus-related pol polyprotein from transposon TNT 1-94 [Tanacetum coccineum]